MELQKSNDLGYPVIHEQINYLDHYQIEDVGPNGMYSLAEKILNEEVAAIDYLWNAHRMYGNRQSSCDEECRRATYC